jgi:hypothetical protein
LAVKVTVVAAQVVALFTVTVGLGDTLKLLVTLLVQDPVAPFSVYVVVIEGVTTIVAPVPPGVQV